MDWVFIKKLDYINVWQYFYIFIFKFLLYCFMWLKNQIPGMNLQMSISAKVHDIMIKIADYSVNGQMFAAFLLFVKFYHINKTVQLIYYGSHLRGLLGFIFFHQNELKFHLHMIRHRLLNLYVQIYRKGLFT